MSSSISTLQQYQMSSMQNEYSTLLGTSSSSNLLTESIEQVLSPTALYNEAEQATQNTITNDQSATEQANALAQFSSYANTLYQYANQLQTSTEDGSNSTATSDISNFVDAYNNMISFANENNQYLTSSVVSDLNSNYNNISSDLQSIGITQNSDGTLSIDQDTLDDALQNDPSAVQSSFSGSNGIAVTTGAIAQSIIQSPLSDYASQTNTTNSTTSATSGSSALYNNFAVLQEFEKYYQQSLLLNSFA